MVPGLRPTFVAAMILWTCSLSANAQSISEAVRKSAQANALVQAGKSEQALPIYKELVSAFPNEISFKLNLSIALYKAGRYRDAVAECELLSKQHPEMFPTWLFLGASYLKLGDFLGAEGPLRKAVSIQPNDPNARIMFADALLALQHWEESAEQYELAAPKIPDNPRVWFGLGRSYEALVDRSLDLLGNAAQASALSCELELDRDQFALAYTDCRRALALSPSFKNIHAIIAKIYEDTGHLDWAATEPARDMTLTANCSPPSLACKFTAGLFQEVAATRADSLDAIYWQGRAFLALSRQAYQHLKELPPSRESYEAEAVDNEKRGQYPQAAAAWKRALQFEPTDAQLQRQLALALCHSNDCVGAIPLLKEQIVHDPSSVELNYLCGLALNSTRNPEQAIPYLETAVKLDATFLPAHAALGEAYFEAGKAERAIAHLKAASLEDPDGIRHYQLARAYQAAGMHDQSTAVLSEYRNIIKQRSSREHTEPAITPP